MTQGKFANLGAHLRAMPKDKLHELLSQLTEEEAQQILFDWRGIWARPSQLFEDHWPENIFLFMAGRGAGKAVSKATHILTVNRGWITMGEIAVGDQVFDEHGNPCNVKAVYDKKPEELAQCYRVEFADKTSIDACGDHLWTTWTHRDRKQLLRYPENGTFPPENWASFRGDVYKTVRKAGGGNSKHVVGSYGPEVRSTQDIFDTLRQNTKRQDLNHCIPVCDPLQFPERPVPIDPYLFGMFLGDGCKNTSSFAIYKDDQSNFLGYVHAKGYEAYPTKATPDYLVHVKGFITQLKAAGLEKKDHIPDEYLFNSEEVRLQFLKGFLDTDGYTDGKHIEFCSKSKLHADTVYYLAASLGQRPVVAEGRATLNGVDHGIKYRVTWTPTRQCFRLKRRADLYNYENTAQKSRQKHRMITDVVPIPTPDDGMVCITVDSPNKLFLVGRNFIPTHNTRSGAEWIKEQERKGQKQMVLAAPTFSDIRDVMVLGPSGLLSVYAPDDPRKPEFEPSKSRLLWPSGAVARMIAAETPEKMRGNNLSIFWADEVGSWTDKDPFDQLMMSLRTGLSKGLITTTPRANAIMIELNKRIGKDVRLIQGSTWDNEANLTDAFITQVKSAYAGTRLGDQELEGKLILTSDDALWSHEMIELCQVDPENLPTNFIAGAIGIDPAGSTGKKSDLTGINLSLLGEDGILYVMYDLSGKYSPQTWANKAINLYDQWSNRCAMTIVVERNQGGNMVRDTLSRERPFLPIKDIFSSTDKLSRASPVALIYEQGKVKHVRGNGLSTLEEEQMTFDGKGRKSPDRLDALVFAITHLMPAKKSFVTSEEFFL